MQTSLVLQDIGSPGKARLGSSSASSFQVRARNLYATACLAYDRQTLYRRQLLSLETLS